MAVRFRKLGWGGGVLMAHNKWSTSYVPDFQQHLDLDFFPFLLVVVSGFAQTFSLVKNERSHDRRAPQR